MKTPIYDFARKYAESGAVRFHMPGHKGTGPLGIEQYDLTEIYGADDLFLPEGIIAESEANATALFGTAYTVYSTEGSTLAIKTMLALATRGGGRILAARSAHKAFIHAAALLDFDFEWIYPDGEHLCDGNVDADAIDKALAKGNFSAVYITSPDYLGNISEIAEISRVCKKHGAKLLVDNAHGAYLAFLKPSLHPISLGADMCCDSAHKTLPVLTGGAYLHIANGGVDYTEVKRAMSLFASSSPSYLILESLDLANKRLSESYPDELRVAIDRVGEIKSKISDLGYEILPSEPLKIVISPLTYGYTGEELMYHLRSLGIHIEFYDRDVAVLMATPDNLPDDYSRLYGALSSLSRKEALLREKISIPISKRVLSPREAMLSEHESVSVSNAVGRICAGAAVSCPPAIPIVALGEEISDAAINVFRKYNIEKIEVVKNA